MGKVPVLAALGGLLLSLLSGCREEILTPRPGMPPTIVDLESSWVAVFARTGFRGRNITIRYPETASDLAGPPEGGGEGLEGRVASVEWQVPEGWMAVLYGEVNYQGKRYPLFGTGRIESIADLGAYAGEAVSVRWERREGGAKK